MKLYASLGDAYRANDRAAFNQEVDLLANRMAQLQPTGTKRARYEFLFNQVDPFTHSMTLYVLAFLFACISWLAWQRPLNRAAFYLLLVAIVVHTFGLVSRMYLQERPPVTNLYSSAIFIGWGAVIVALILERIFRDGIGAACAGAIGFITLIIAHHLAGNGDTLEMLQAVLDTNIWLATHVVAITTGYSAMFLAGMLAIIYVVRGVFTRSLTKQTADSLARMTYGVVCFATLFSFVGTVLGGIWADQSWGRFWGWDPKENGAVLIVLWCAIILHARWGGFIRQRGLMIMAIFGNVVTSFSWFGVNMLGVGLHSYGFMQKAFPWLVGFHRQPACVNGRGRDTARTLAKFSSNDARHVERSADEFEICAAGTSSRNNVRIIQKGSNMKAIVSLTISLFIASAMSSHAADAKALWDANCAQCHGKDGRADTKMGKQVNAKDLTDPKVQAGFSDAKATQSIKEGVKENGKTTMKAFGGKLTDDEIKALVAYVRTLKK